MVLVSEENKAAYCCLSGCRIGHSCTMCSSSATATPPQCIHTLSVLSTCSMRSADCLFHHVQAGKTGMQEEDLPGARSQPHDHEQTTACGDFLRDLFSCRDSTVTERIDMNRTLSQLVPRTSKHTCTYIHTYIHREREREN